MRKINHFHLPAQTKILAGLVCSVFLFILSSLSAPEAKALQCVSYATCHYQSGTGITCPPWAPKYGLTEPFQFCVCKIDTSGFSRKFVFNECSNQSTCNAYLRMVSGDPYKSTPWGIACPYEYRGDFCGCSGRPKPMPSSGPTPQPTPIPTVPPRVSCYKSCEIDANCEIGLVCGYYVNAGRRICHNPACAAESDCRCSWQ